MKSTRWKLLDKRFRHFNSKIEAAHRLGYSTISEALVTEYRKLRSARKIGDLLGLTSNGVRFALHDFGVKVAGPGGYRAGDVRRGRPKAR
jgi:EAL domain-containing protein (putative c-di-GMP-specific phosphodiesterase class I)